MKYFYKTLFLFVILYFSNQKINAVTVTDSAAAANVQVCLKKEIVRLAFSVGSSGTTGSYLEIKLPDGFTWEGLAYGPIVQGGSGSNTITYAGLQPNGRHRLNFGSSTNIQTIRLGFWQKASCSAGTSSFTAQDSLFFYEGTGTINLSATNLFNGVVPDLSITNITHTPGTATVGTVVTRKFTVTNGGFGSTSNFLIADVIANAGEYTLDNSSFVINPSGVNYAIPISEVSTSGDSIIVRFDANTILQIANNDTLFANGESFDLEYTFTVNTCAVPTIISRLLTTWRCQNNARCTYYGVNVGFSTFGPAIPNIVHAGNKLRKTDCYDGVTVNRDTILLRNIGGLATSLIFQTTATSYGASSRIDLDSYMDTASFKVKIGKNGTWYKPSYTVIQTVGANRSSIGCNFLGKSNTIHYSKFSSRRYALYHYWTSTLQLPICL